MSYTPTGSGSSVSIAVNTATDTVYVGSQTDQLVVINGSSNAVVTTLTLPGPVIAIAVDSQTNIVYAVVSGSAAEVAVVDGVTNSVSASIPVPTGVVPEGGIAVDSSTDQIYVTDQAAGSAGSAAGGGVFDIDGGTDGVVSSFSSGGGDPVSAAVDESTNTLWVADLLGPVAEINAATGALLNSLSLGGEPTSVAINPVTDTVYAGARAAGGPPGGLTEIDGSSGAITTTLPVPCYGVAVDPNADVIYATSAGGAYYATTVIDGATNSVGETITRGGVRVAADPATGLVYETTPPTTAARIHPGLWTITPASADGLSPVIPFTSASATFTTGVAGSYTVTASALPAATFTEAGALPAGVTLSPSGTLSGTPAPGTGGVYTFTVTAGNGIPSDYAQPLTLTVLQPAQAAMPPSETFTVGTAVSVPLQITGYPAPQIYGNLPAGLNVVQNPPGQYQLTGTPAVGSGGVYTGDIQAVNIYASTVVGSSSAPFSMTVNEAPTIRSAATATFGVGSSLNSFQVTATGYPDHPTFAVSGDLPPGVSFRSSGEFSGIPPPGSEGVYHLTITATNSLGTTSQAFALDVAANFGPIAGGVLGDVTGDGLADILAIDSAGRLWLYPNTGSGDANMFADARSQVGQGWTGYTLAAVAPLYGSARAGILAIDSSGRLWYYPNTGGSGLGTFGARSLVGSGWIGYTVVGLSDLYGTGQPGIVTYDPNGIMWYYPNTGGSGVGTWGARSQVGSDWGGLTADVADINGDGMPDLLVVDTVAQGTLSLYPNTGGTGISTFDGPFPISYGWSGDQALDVGQLTGTGPDGFLAVDPEGQLWFYPNNGAGTFGTPVLVGSGWTGYTIN